MNNLLKIFLLVILIPSTTSSVNNYSMPLPETELKMGQNVSELTERGEPITLVAGTPVVGISVGSGGDSQNDCTLSFPVIHKNDGQKGFLTSFDCGDNYFVNGVQIGDGKKNGPGTFSPSKGIDYHFINIYPEYWSDEVSQKILYSQCDGTCSDKILIPLLPIISAEPPLKYEVCAYGGASGYVCGVIVDFDVTITVKNAPFHPVTKVQMNKPCLGGDVSAPVYVSIQIPDSKKVVASPVGQVVKDEKNSEVNMWYYVPIKRIFQDAESFSGGGFELAVGSSDHPLPPEPDKPIYLHGGVGVTGITLSKDGLTVQRPCTLSFPVIKYGRYKGFLISRDCANSDILVGDKKVGKVVAPGSFVPRKGLDYILVDVYPEYWSDEVSRKVDSSQCDSADGDTFIPLLPTPSEPPSNFKVCAYGGVSNFTCGVIVGFDVTITVKNSEGEDTQFFHVTKARMGKPYSHGDLGAPVYIPIQVPDSDQFVASPVGQVVEAVDNKEQNVWYYVPLDRILKDNEGDLEIAVGNLSYLLPKPPNDEDSNDTSSSDDLAMSLNASEINLVSRQPKEPQILYTHAGLDFRISSSGGRIYRPGILCTLGFAVKRTRGRHGTHPFDHGFLTLGGCLPSDRGPRRSFVAFYVRRQNQAEEVIKLGAVGTGFAHDPARGLSYVALNLLPNDEERTLWDDDISTQMPISEEAVADIYNQARSPNNINIRDRVCWHGGCSGHRCGKVVDTRATLNTFNPWRWPIYLHAVIYGLRFELYSPEDNYEGLIKVRLDDDDPAPPRTDDFNCDRGSPVYYPTYEGRHITRVQPVGILLDYFEEYENIDGRCVAVHYMYCISVYKILFNNELNGQNLELIGENFA